MFNFYFNSFKFSSIIAIFPIIAHFVPYDTVLFNAHLLRSSLRQRAWISTFLSSQSTSKYALHRFSDSRSATDTSLYWHRTTFVSDRNRLSINMAAHPIARREALRAAQCKWANIHAPVLIARERRTEQTQVRRTCWCAPAVLAADM